MIPVVKSDYTGRHTIRERIMADRRLKLGIAGLGRGFTVMLPTLALDKRLEIVAAVDTRPAALERFGRFSRYHL